MSLHEWLYIIFSAIMIQPICFVIAWMRLHQKIHKEEQRQAHIVNQLKEQFRHLENAIDCGDRQSVIRRINIIGRILQGQY